VSFSLAISAGAAEPEIVRLRVPAQDVSRWFPAGTELRVLPAERFDALVRAAMKGIARQQAAQPTRLVRARHHARWKAGVLSGRTELVIDAASTGAADFVLDPWTPAILDKPELSRVGGARDSGKPSLWVEQAPSQSVVLEWEVQPRGSSHARTFDLAVPGEETTILALELPGSMIPLVNQGRRRGPLECTLPGWSLWEIEAESGRIDVRVHDCDGGGSVVVPDPWISTGTTIDLRKPVERGGGLANFTADWRVELDHRNPKPLEIDVDPSLELIDVQGEAVRGYKSTKAGGSTRVEVTLGGEPTSATAVRFLAHARIPLEGTWKIPALRPRNATWTGGGTTVILDEFHVLQECREKAGRRVLEGAAVTGVPKRVVLEAGSPGSPADLVFQKPRAEASCSVLGQLFVARAPCRLECQLTWRLRSGSTSELEVELSPAWLPDRVSIRNLEDPIAWHSSVLPSGATRLHVALPATALGEEELVLVIGAASTVSGGRGPLELPRVRPAGARLGDEAWLAWVDQSTMIQPTAAVGLAWIDPREVEGLRTAGGADRDLHEALAWRWIAADAQARIERELIEREASASVHIHAHVDPVAKLLALDGRLVASAGAASLDSVPIWINQPDEMLRSWSFRDEGGAIELAPHPIDQPARERLGFPKQGSARSLLTKVAGQTEKTIYFHAEFPWKSQGSIPLVAVPRDYLFRGMVVVETPAGTRSRVQSVGLRCLDSSAGETPALEADPDFAAGIRDDVTSASKATVCALAYDEPGGQLDLITEQLVPFYPAGIVRDAVLTTVVDPKGTTLNRLRLLVHSGDGRAVDIVPRPDMTLVHIRRDGSDVVPISTGSCLSIPLPGSGPMQRSSTIVIDYLSDGGRLSDGGLLRPHLPALGLPCLSFDWQVIAPPAWKAADCGRGLIAVDQENLEQWPSAALGVWRPGWLVRRTAAGDELDWLPVLDARLIESSAAELTFAEWFSRWDAGPWPLVIDRLSLLSAGLGPRSPCVPSRVKAERESVSAATLARHGLAIVRFPGALVITSLVDAPLYEEHDRWEQAIAESLLWGSDLSDRFETVPRWRAGTFTRVSPATGDAAEGIKVPQGWSTWRFGSSSWPGADSFIHLIDSRTRILSGWIIALSCASGWFAVRRRLSRWRIPLLAGLMAGILVINWLLPSRFASYTAAAFIGALASLMLELGEGAAAVFVAGRTTRRSGSSLVRRAAGSAVGLALCGLVVGELASAAQPFDLQRELPIIALFPYEGPFDPSRPAKDVVLRLADFTRLSRWASGGAVPAFRSVRAVSALHRVVRKSAQEIVVDSELELDAVGQAPWSWRIPVKSARGILATLDEERLPISIEPGGEYGTLAISRAGRHLLRIHRTTSARSEGGFETLSLPVNALPTARLIVEPFLDGKEPVETKSTGSMPLHAGQAEARRLGAADRIEVRWPKPGSVERPPAATAVEGLNLWDINPAGDRVRARFTLQQALQAPSIRFAHQPGLVFRSGRISAQVDAVWEDDVREDEWVLHTPAPLPAGATIALDCWMPGELPRGGGDEPPAESGEPAGFHRRLPRLQPVGVERYFGAIGVRRPGDWTGRFDPIADTEAISDESFVKSWGSLPEEPLTLCGTSRFAREPRAALVTGPPPTRILVKPTVGLELQTGRIALSAVADLTEQSGQLRELEAQLPDGIRSIEVTADGLADWVTTPDNRLRLIFDRQIPGPRRLVRIRGWIPVALDPLRTGPRRHRVPVPWIEWRGTDASAGVLTVVSNAKAELPGAGLAQTASESVTAGGSTFARHSQTYRVGDTRKLGDIVWESAPARVGVLIESQLTIHPDSAEWVAVLRYDVMGGALDVIHLRMPAAWSASAVVHMAGKHQLTTEIREKMAYWTITPERPIWGSQRIVLRSSRPLGADREIAHPEISPLGRGQVDTYLGIVNAMGRPAASESAVGLEKIPHATRFQAREFAGGIGTPGGAYRVAREVWSLRVPLPRNLVPANQSRDGSARLALADVIVVALPDRSCMGRAVFETIPGSGSSLALALPAGCSLLWASTDGNPVIPFRSSLGTWSISVDNHRESRVGVIWKSAAGAFATSGQSWPVPLPRAGLGPAPAAVAVYAPPEFMIQGNFGGLEPTAMARVEMARADWLAGAINDLIAKFDRSSGRDHEKLVSLLVGHEMALRGAARSDRRGDPDVAIMRASGPGVSTEKIRAARSARFESVRRAGLGADMSSVQWYLGEAQTPLTGSLIRVPAASTFERIRLFGQPFPLLGVIPGADEPLARTSLTLGNRPWVGRLSFPPVRSMVTLVLLGGLVLVTTGVRASRWMSALGVVMALAIAYSLAGPMIALGSLGIAAAGWSKARG
jgi:hypothetical protein